MRRTRAACLLVGVLGLATLSAGCATDAPEGESQCPLSLTYRGDTYLPLHVRARVRGTRAIGPARFACVTHDAAGRQDAKARFPARAVPGVDPDVAFVVPSRWPHTVFYSGPSGGFTMPSGHRSPL